MFKLAFKETGKSFYATLHSAGFDICATESVMIPSNGWLLIHTGMYIVETMLYYPHLKILNCEVNSYPREEHLTVKPELQIRSRSGLARDFGLVVLGGISTVDADSRAEIMVPLFNHNPDLLLIEKGDRIAQGVCALVHQLACLDVRPVQRGNNGFGSTGIQ